MRRLIVLVSALVVLAAGCAADEAATPEAAAPTATGDPAADEGPGAGTDEPVTDGPEPSATSEPTSPETGGGIAPFEGAVATVDGGTLAGADYAGRDLALWFWTPW